MRRSRKKNVKNTPCELFNNDLFKYRYRGQWWTIRIYRKALNCPNNTFSTYRANILTVPVSAIALYIPCIGITGSSDFHVCSCPSITWLFMRLCVCSLSDNVKLRGMRVVWCDRLGVTSWPCARRNAIKINKRFTGSSSKRVDHNSNARLQHRIGTPVSHVDEL